MLWHQRPVTSQKSRRYCCAGKLCFAGVQWSVGRPKRTAGRRCQQRGFHFECYRPSCSVCCCFYGNFSSAFRNAPTLLARDFSLKTPSIVSSVAAVRRLTPGMCQRLQGFPDQWCSDLASENPQKKKSTDGQLFLKNTEKR